MPGRDCPLSRFLATFTALLVGAATLAAEPPREDELDRQLAEFCRDNDIPAVAAAVFKNGEIRVSGVAGVRRLGSKDPVRIDDRFHIGSCGKSMTAWLLASLVEDGLLKWETTIADVFPEWRQEMRAEYHRVTLLQLLSHTAALPDPWADTQWKDVVYPSAHWPADHRVAAARDVLKRAPIGVPGEVLQYSNVGYAIATAMAERRTGRSWSFLLRRRVFDPLKLDSISFGAPASLRNTAQPLGHARRGETWTPVGPETDDYRVPFAIAPAGDIHCTIEDFARWAGAHLPGLRNEGKSLLSADSIRKMHTPVCSNYGMGWRMETTSGGDRVDMHNGSEGTFSATMAVFPDLNAAVVVAVNRGDAKRECNQLLFALANRYAP